METLKCIVLIENILGVYRNFSTLGKYQNLAFYRMLFEISVQVTSLVFLHKCSDSLNADTVYYTLSHFSSMFIICIAVYHSKEFSKIIKQHANFTAYFPTDEIYKQNLNSRKKVVYYFLLAYNLCCFSTYSAYYVQVPVDEVFGSQCSTGLFYVIEFTVFLSDFRFIAEIPIISVFFYVLLDQLDAISRSLKTEINYIKRSKAQHRFDDSYYSHYRKGIIYDNWCAAYTIVVKKTKICRDVFGFQVCIVTPIFN